MARWKNVIAALGLMVSGSVASAGDLCSTDWKGFQTKLRDDHNRLAFRNSGGPMKIGLCWWHSRMQRNANFLLDFRPSQPKLSRDEALSVIKGLSSTDAVMAVNGYRNLFDFSYEYYDEMTESLGQWQMAESFFKFNWLNGLEGESSINSTDLELKMDELFSRVQGKRETVYQMLQYPGPAAHAWLVLGMTKTAAGYSIEAVDSNYTYVTKKEYFRGDTHLNGDFGDFVPYTQRTEDLDSIRGAISRTCQSWGKKSALAPR